MTLVELWALSKDLGIVDTELTTGTIDRIFVAVRRKASSELHNPHAQILFREFLEMWAPPRGCCLQVRID